MDYSKIFKQTYEVALRNPALWIFGLFLASGFNLNAVYAIISKRSDITWDAVRQAAAGRPLWVGVGSLSAILLFLIGNYLKVWFFSEVHEKIHPSGTRCPLCSERANRQT